MAIPKRPMTPERKQIFLDSLAEFGLITLACKAASPHCPAGSTKIFYKARKEDEVFRQAWDDALDHADDLILQEMRRRGIEGWDEETQWGTVHKYSDKMLEVYGKVKSNRIREALSNKVEVTATVQPTLGIEQLSPKSQELLRQILEEEKKPDELLLPE